MKAIEKIHKLILDHQNEFGFHSNFDFMNEALDELEKERDEFAIAFANWLMERYLLSTSEQLIDQFKKTL
jgi:hypothetical protein